jgi:hypothetical protein
MSECGISIGRGGRVFYGCLNKVFMFVTWNISFPQSCRIHCIEIYHFPHIFCVDYGAGVSVLGIVTRLLAGLCVVGKTFICTPKRRGQLWVPASLLFSGYRQLVPVEYSGRGVKLITHLHVTSNLRMSAAISLISGLRRDVDEIRGLLGNYTASCGSFLTCS